MRTLTAAVLSTLAAAAFGATTEADAVYYADFAEVAADVGKQLDRVGELMAKANTGKSYSAESEDRAADLGDDYHALEAKVPPADALTAHKALLDSAEIGAQASLELASYFKDDLKKKEKLTQALDTYEKAVGKYADAMAAAPASIGRK